jgi:cell division GTPase FtsZ
MKLAVIGFGNAGGKITDEILAYEFETGRSLCRSALAVNSARVDLERLEHVPEANRHLIGQTDERSKGHGVGGDPDLGAEVARRDSHELERALDDVPVYDVDAFLVIAGLGGGTGSGGAPVFAEKIREVYAEPVYGFGVLPSAEEGGRASLNAARSFPTFAGATDNLFVFDNGSWRQSDATVEATYEETNREIAKRVATLLSAGEIDGSQVSENAMDASDVRRTLDTGGVSVVAYAETELEPDQRQGLLDKFRGTPNQENGADPAAKVNGLIRQAVRSRLTCEADVESAERSLVVVSGPPSELSRKGLESGRRWLEETTDSVEVLAGDDPRSNADVLSAVVLLSNVTDVPRIEAMQDQAVEAQENIEAQAETRERDIQELVTDSRDELDPV